MEVKYIWGSKFRLSTLLYILCRYSLVGNVLYLLAISKKLEPRVSTDYLKLNLTNVILVCYPIPPIAEG